MARYYTLRDIGQRVAAERRKRGETQAEAGVHFGVSQVSVSKAERAMPGMEELLRLMAAHYLGLQFSKEEYRRVE